RPVEDLLPLDLGVVDERAVAGRRDTQVHQVAQLVAGVAEPKGDRPPARGALGGRGAGDDLPRRVLQPRPEDRGQPTVPGDGTHHGPVSATGQQPQGPVEVGLARAVGAGDDIEAVQPQGQVPDRAVSLDRDRADHLVAAALRARTSPTVPAATWSSSARDSSTRWSYITT